MTDYFSGGQIDFPSPRREEGTPQLIQSHPDGIVFQGISRPPDQKRACQLFDGQTGPPQNLLPALATHGMNVSPQQNLAILLAMFHLSLSQIGQKPGRDRASRKKQSTGPENTADLRQGEIRAGQMLDNMKKNDDINGMVRQR